MPWSYFGGLELANLGGLLLNRAAVVGSVGDPLAASPIQHAFGLGLLAAAVLLIVATGTATHMPCRRPPSGWRWPSPGAWPAYRACSPQHGGRGLRLAMTPPGSAWARSPVEEPSCFAWWPGSTVPPSRSSSACWVLSGWRLRWEAE